VNDTAITLTAGSFLSGGGVLNLNQATPETITFNVDSVSLKNSIGAFDSTITLGTTGGLTGGGFFTVDAKIIKQSLLEQMQLQTQHLILWS
jgi:hypothetical protein